jgi:mono/diheme cytochrome c family protein
MRRPVRVLLVFLLAAVLALLAGPAALRGWWAKRSSNPVRRGVERARELGCFSCHGDLGRAGIRDPGAPDAEVPAWSGGLWMMYVRNDEEIRRYIRDGSTPKLEGGAAAISMPPFGDALEGTDLEDLAAAFRVLSGMTAPKADTPEGRGRKLAEAWGCFACHGPGGSGGLPNPGSFTGFVPGWYGADFEDLVRGREEFVTWVREGGIPRLRKHPIASRFLRTQKLAMPAYRSLSPEETEDLWAYVRWLGRTDGGIRGE